MPSADRQTQRGGDVNSGLETRAATVAQFMVSDLDSPKLDLADSHHLKSVLRARSGEKVSVIDGTGAWRICEFDGAGLGVAGAIFTEERERLAVRIGFSVTKGSKPELVVQKLVELGVDAVYPVTSERTIVHWDDTKRAKNIERLRSIAKEAVMQSRRVFLPDIFEVRRLSDFAPSNIALCHWGGLPLDVAWSDSVVVPNGPLRAENRFAEAGEGSDATSGKIFFVGPEGGWTSNEIQRAGMKVDLGPAILRSETAALAVAVRLCVLRDAVGATSYP